MARLANISVDTSTTRLISAANATLMTEGLPRDSARTLVASAKGCRLYLEAGQRPLARQQLDNVEKLMATCDDALLKTAYDRLVSEVRKALKWEDEH